MMEENKEKSRLLRGDLTIWIILFLLCMVSIVEVYSASATLSYGSAAYWKPVTMHAILIGIGLFFAWVLHWIPSRLYRLLLPLGHAFSIVLLIVVLILGHATNGAARWINLGFINFQPSELAKLTLMGTIALILSKGFDKKEDRVTPKAFKIMLAVAVPTCLLILFENLSTAVMVGLVTVVVTWMAKPPKKLFYTIGGTLIISAGLLILILATIPKSTSQSIGKCPGLSRFPTWVNRVQDRDTLPANPKDFDIYANSQYTHSKIAIGTSGIFGCGPGQSEARDYLPQAYSDFIYAIIIEEGGLVSGIFVMGLYLILFYRCVRISQRCKKKFQALLVMGLSCMLVTQAMINMAVAVGAMPITGQTLPLVSRGGTSMLVTCAFIGIILSVSRGAMKNSEVQKVPSNTENNE